MIRKEINEIFTPRRSNVNSEMYIERPELEKHLLRSIRGSMHSFLFGESGNGKSWLYKKVLTERKIINVVVNCANASRRNSITEEIFSVSTIDEYGMRTSSSKSSQKGFDYLAKYEETKQDNYEIKKEDKLLLSFQELSKNHKNTSVIIFDNVETLIEKENLLNELSDMIILLDDERYAKFNIKFLLVGLPNSVLKYFTTTKNSSSVSNRIEEIPKVVGLKNFQVLNLIKKGFIDLLHIDISETNLDKLSQHITNITLGVPQRVHEYCECLAYLLEDNHYEYNNDLLAESDQSWLVKGLRESYSVIDGYLNSEETINGRRNQVIYCIGKSSGHQITTTSISEKISKEFVNNQPESNSGIGKVLSHLTKGDNPLIKKISKSNNGYILCDPRHLMCIRVILRKDDHTEKIIKRSFTLN